jgi:hypothetical protein
MRVSELAEARYHDNYLTIPDWLLFDVRCDPPKQALPSCRSNQWNLSPVQIVGLVTNSFAWKRNRRGLTGKLFAEAAVRHWLDVRAISSSNTSSSAAREGKQNGRAEDSWVRPEPRSRGKTFLRRLGVEQPRLGPCRRKDLNWLRSLNASA